MAYLSSVSPWVDLYTAAVKPTLILRKGISDCLVPATSSQLSSASSVLSDGPSSESRNSSNTTPQISLRFGMYLGFKRVCSEHISGSVGTVKPFQM